MKAESIGGRNQGSDSPRLSRHNQLHVFRGGESRQVRQFFDAVMALGVEGMMISPGYRYEKERESQMRRLHGPLRL